MIEGNTVEIITSLGKINGTITQIQGDIATIKTGIGEIKVTLLLIENSQQNTSNTNSLWRILAVVITIAVITVLALVVRILKKRARDAS